MRPIKRVYQHLGSPALFPLLHLCSHRDEGIEYPETRLDVFDRLTFELEVERRIDDPEERKEIMKMIKNDDYCLSRLSPAEDCDF
jgi:hypothetical protein